MAFSESKRRTSPPFLPNLLVTKQTKQKRKEKSLMNIRQGYVFSFEDAINLQPRSRLEIILATLDFDDVITVLF